MPKSLELNRGRLILWLSLIAGVLTLINIPMTLLEYRLQDVSWGLSKLARCMTLDSENSIPAWFSSGLLFLCGIALAISALTSRANGDSWWKHWAGLAGLFAALSIDEAVGFHEQLMDPVRAMIGDVSVLHFAWVIPGAVFVLAVGFTFLGFLRSLPLRTSLRFIGSGAIYVGGALGLEVVGGWLFATVGEADLRYIAVATLEESCELFGLILFLRAVLIHFEQTFGRLSLTVLPPLPESALAGTSSDVKDERRQVVPAGTVA
jgi:hypothetical protein